MANSKPLKKGKKVKEKEVSIQEWDKDRKKLGAALAAATLYWHLDQDFEQAIDIIKESGGAGDFWYRLADVAMEGVNDSLYELTEQGMDLSGEFVLPEKKGVN